MEEDLYLMKEVVHKLYHKLISTEILLTQLEIIGNKHLIIMIIIIKYGK